MFKDFFKRAIMHAVYQLIIVIPIMLIIMLTWWFFAENMENLFAMLMLSFSIGLLVFTVLNIRFRLPNYDIWKSQHKDTKEGIYLLQFIFACILVVLVLYNFNWFPKYLQL